MTKEELEIKERVRALYEMYHAMARVDKKILDLVEEEIIKISKYDFHIIKQMPAKYINFFVNRRIRALKKPYKNGDILAEEVSNEINELVSLKMNVWLTLTEKNVDEIMSIK